MYLVPVLLLLLLFLQLFVSHCSFRALVVCLFKLYQYWPFVQIAPNFDSALTWAFNNTQPQCEASKMHSSGDTTDTDRQRFLELDWYYYIILTMALFHLKLLQKTLVWAMSPHYCPNTEPHWATLSDIFPNHYEHGLCSFLWVRPPYSILLL